MYYLILILLIIGLASVLIKFIPKYLKLANSFEKQLSAYKENELKNQMDEHKKVTHEQLEKVAQENINSATQTALAMVAEWRVKFEEATRQDAINKSQAIMMGKALEHLIPYFPSFHWNPKDARFLGSPTDLIVFDGLSAGKLQQIVFVEIKTNTSQLSERERQIRDIINNGRVKWEELRHFTNVGIVKP